MNIRKLDADERPKHLYTYIVEGSGYFPTDMLRYDSCWPTSQRDVDTMSNNGPRGGILRAISLTSHRLPTVGRWVSFTWRVLES